MATPVGGYVLAQQPIEINAGRPKIKIKVRNTGDRASMVGSHYHFFEVNRWLEFDRQKAFGMHLDVPAGVTTRFEAGAEVEVTLVAYGGKRRVWGFNDLVNSWTLSTYDRAKAYDKAKHFGFKSTTPYEIPEWKQHET